MTHVASSRLDAASIDFRSAMSVSDMEANGNAIASWLLLGLFPGETACSQRLAAGLRAFSQKSWCSTAFVLLGWNTHV
jgi:hypothetical protein